MAKRRYRRRIAAVAGGVIIIVIVMALFFAAYHYNFIRHPAYDDDDFAIVPYRAATDADGDGSDDQTDILNEALAYIETKPKYRSAYYAGGYPDDGYGVCADVVAFALKGAGFDLRDAVAADVAAHPDDYVDAGDSDIDFRRVRNLAVFFPRHAMSLTTDVTAIEAWHGGDIVLWEDHIGVVAADRNGKGVPFVIHHATPVQRHYQEDVLTSWGKIIGHYRVDADHW